MDREEKTVPFLFPAALGVKPAVQHNGMDMGMEVHFRPPGVEYIATCHAIIRDGRLLATGTTEELVKLVEGKVWSCIISARAAPEYESRLQIISLRNENDGSVSIRYLAECPCNNSSPFAFPVWRICICGCFPRAAGKTGKGH